MTTFRDNEHFVDVCLKEGLTRQAAVVLLSFAKRNQIGIDDPFMALMLILGLIDKATAHNLQSTTLLAEEAASRAVKALGTSLVNTIRQRALLLQVRWAIGAGVLGLLLLAVTFSIGATIGVHGQVPSSAWQRVIEQNTSLPDALAACGPTSHNYRLENDRPSCGVWLQIGAGIADDNWFQTAFLAASHRLGRHTPMSLLAIGLGLGLLPYAFTRTKHLLRRA